MRLYGAVLGQASGGGACTGAHSLGRLPVGVEGPPPHRAEQGHQRVDGAPQAGAEAAATAAAAAASVRSASAAALPLAAACAASAASAALPAAARVGRGLRTWGT
eukprot:13817458-Alexandrium_andersonii.AAC.1